MNEHEAKVSDIFGKVFPDSGDLVLLRKDEEPWSSLQTLAIIFTLEEEFGVSLGDDDIKSITSFEEVVRLIGRLLA